MKAIDKILLYLYISFILVFILFLGNKIFIVYDYLDIESIKMLNYDKNNNIMSIEIIRKANSLNDKFSCIAYDGIETLEVLGKDDKCKFDLENVTNYNFYLQNSHGTKSNIYKLSNAVDNVLSFTYAEDVIYLTVGEEKEIKFYDIVIDKSIDYDFKVKDEDIVAINGKKIKGLKNGETIIYTDKTKETLKVIVTDLLTLPYATKDKKEILSCNVYNEDEAKLLDNILEYKINEAGYQTRAGAIAAARFLTLEFKYRVPYFYETGRVKYENKDCNMTNINTRIIDGEGRYYHKGLYLANSKKSDITASKVGPAIWGCNMVNYEDKPEYGFYVGKLMPNGLDCSGFITWALKNAGFSPGDVGAGDDPGRNCQCTDLGKLVKLNNDLLDSGDVKVGDLINWWGHIAMIIGIDKENDKYYIAESLSYIGGVRAMIYSKKELIDTFEYVVLMDDYYKEEGNYTNMWRNYD